LNDSLVLIYSTWFALELKAENVEIETIQWKKEVNEVARNWRDALPASDGEYAQGIRWTNPDDAVVLIKLIADSATALIYPSLFELVNKKLPEPEFRVFPEKASAVAIYSEGIRVGGVSQMSI
jgi:hypothetical protein